MTKYGAIAEGERRVRTMAGRSYNIMRTVHTRDYILRSTTIELPRGYVLVATVNSDGTVKEHRAE